MNKTRMEALSDGVFAIVMTLLVLDIHVPELGANASNAALWQALGGIWPIFTSFFLSFLVLSVFWINHNFLFESFIKNVDRKLNLLNLFYLMFLVFVPFSARLLGAYPNNGPAALIYGLNILAIVLMLRFMIMHVRRHSDLGYEVSSRLVKQSTIRTLLSIVSYVLGIIAAFVYIPASIFFYLFPMLFNIIPGTLDLFERVFKFELT